MSTAGNAPDRFAISLVGSKFDNTPRRERVTWAELVGRLTKPRLTACTLADCGAGEHAELDGDGKVIGCRRKNGPGWIPATFSTGRKKTTAEHVSLLVVDADHLADDAALQEVLARLARYAYVAHATHSDRPGDRCARIVLPLSQSVPAADWPRFWPAAMAALGMPADPSCCDASRLYYLPARPADGGFWFSVQDGESIDVKAIVASAPVTAPTIASSLNLGVVGAVGPGERHAMLKSLAGSMRHRGAGLVEIEAALLLANQHRCDPPKSEAAVRDIAAWAAAQPISSLPQRPRPEPALHPDDAPPPDPPADDVPHAADRAPPAPDPRRFRMTEIGNAERCAATHGARFRYVHGRGWSLWDGKRWGNADRGEEMKAAKSVVAGLFTEAATLSSAAAAALNADGSQTDAATRSSGLAASLIDHARKSSKASALDAMLKLARSEEPIAAARCDFDGDPFLFNVANGTIDLRTGRIRSHRQTDMITKLAPVAYDPDAKCPRWETFLARVLPDPELLAWVQRFLGYALTGNVSEQALAFCYGSGANGKNVLLDSVAGVMGDYAIRAAPDLLLSRQGEAHPTQEADLDGARLVLCSEIDEGRAWNEALIKRITGDRMIKARRMRADFYEFAATHKLIIAANSKPKVRGTDNGIWRRMNLIPFDVTIPPEERIRDFDQVLLGEEAPGILAWLVRGCIAWQTAGLGNASAISEATAEYREEQDVLGQWIAEECVLVAGAFTPTTRLYELFKPWCERAGRQPWTRDAMRAGLSGRPGIVERRSKVARGFDGIGIAEHARQEEIDRQAARSPRGERTYHRGEA